MDSARVAVLRELLSATGWVDRTRTFARVLRRSTTTPGGLLLVGTPQAEPWHLAAHLDDESRYAGIPELSPTLVRWQAPAGAPKHLAFTMSRLEAAGRGETVFVVAEEVAPDSLLERVQDARTHGATVLSVDGGDTELQSLSHESLTIVQDDLVIPELSFDTVTHLVSVAAGEVDARARKGFRDRLARALDVVSGPAPNRR